MSDDNGRDARGWFTEGNTIHPTTGGGYGLEAQANSGKISEKFAHSEFAYLKRIEAGEAWNLHAVLAARALTVVDGVTATYQEACEKHRQEPSDSTLQKKESAQRHLYTWMHGAALDLQWLHEHPKEGKDAGQVIDDLRSTYGAKDDATNHS